MKVDPLPMPALSARTVPPCCSTMWRTIARPSPSPPSERVVALVQGMAIGDVAFAAHALREATRRELGRVVPLE